MKKLLAGAVSAAMFLSAAIPALAFWPMPPMPTNTATVKGNDVTVVANTGLNEQKVKGVNAPVNQYTETGVAVAEGNQVIAANISVCGGCDRVNNNATVKGNDLLVVANTGLNEQKVRPGMQTLSVQMPGRHHHMPPAPVPTVNQTLVTGGAMATGSQMIVTNVSWGGSAN